jgi:hypothetical protein
MRSTSKGTTMPSKANLRSSGREAALARRRALSTQGKRPSAAGAAERSRAPDVAAAPRPTTPQPQAAVAESLSIGAAQALSASRVVSPARRVQAPVSSSGSSRAEARARREALSKAGKRADRKADRTRVPTPKAPTKPARDEGAGCGCGCGGNPETTEERGSMTDAARLASDRRGASSLGSTTTNGSRRNGKRITAVKPTGRMLALARRSAASGRGKAAVNTPTTTASLARQANPQLSGRDLAQTVRAHRSAAGAAGTRKAQATGRIRPGRERPAGGAQDQPWKVGLSETAQGQFVTGTRVGRSRSVTGDEPSVCREITGTEYMGAEIFREFCQTEPPKPAPKVHLTTTSHGNAVTGNEVGRSTRVTGDEPGTCKTVTGTEYLSAEQASAFCGTQLPPNPRQTGRTRTTGGRPVSGVVPGLSSKVTGNEHGAGIQPTGSQYMSAANGELPDLKKAPPKVNLTRTLGGGSVTGTRVGRSAKLTGDEPGSCRLVTGDEYVGAEQYKEFCGIQPTPLEAPKVGLSSTAKGLMVSGTQTGRSGRVTGDEPGTCKAVTGTPYAGLEQTSTYCAPEQQRLIAERMRPMAAAMATRMTGIQPGIGGVMTGASRGACEEISGTPYVGADQFEETCGSGALPGDSDFPRPLEAAPWQSFSVESPARQAFQASQGSNVTGTLYEQEGRITGPFGMGTGKITGTEQFRFDRVPSVPGNLLQMAPAEAAGVEMAPAAVRSRVTGEGQAAGTKITGDDWERGERVTGTEGPSARRRNPTRPGPMAAMAAVKHKRNEELPAPVSRVTGASGNTDRGSLITYSGGARG